MSNRNNFDDFGDDPFGDDNSFDSFDDDSFGDDFGGDDLDSFDDDLDSLDDERSLFDDDDEVEGESGGPSRVFIFGAVLLILVIVGFLAFIILNSVGDRPPSERDLTATRIVELNLTSYVQLTGTALQSTAFAIQTETATAAFPLTEAAQQATETAEQELIFEEQTLTASALVPTETPQLEATETPDVTGLPSDVGSVVETAQAGTALAETQTAIAGQPTSSGLNATDVLLTATSLFLTLNPTPLDITPGATSPQTFPTPRPGTGNQLPETGLFDGFASGEGMGTVALMAFGLIGLIVVSRRLRSAK